MKDLKIGTVFEYEGDFLIVKREKPPAYDGCSKCVVRKCSRYACLGFQREDETAVYFPKATEKEIEDYMAKISKRTKKRKWRAVETDNATNTWDFISHDDLVFRVYGFGVIDKKMEDVIALIAWSPDMYNLLDRIRNGEAVDKNEINNVLRWIDGKE